MEKPDLAVALNEIERRLRTRRAALVESLRTEGRDGDGARRSSPDDPAWTPEAVGAGRELAAIDAALDGLSRGAYGACRDCGHPIEPARLLSVPLAERCTACHSRRELPPPWLSSSTSAALRRLAPGPPA